MESSPLRALWEVFPNGECACRKDAQRWATRPSDSPLRFGLEQGDESVRWFKRPPAQMRRHDRLNGLEFFRRIGASVNFRSGQITVSQPEGDLANIVGGLKYD